MVLSSTWRTSMRICLDLQTLQHVDPLESALCQSPLTDTHDAIGSEDQRWDQCWDTGPRRMTVSGQWASMIVAGPKIACGGAGISKLRLGQHRNRMPLLSTCIWHGCTGNGADEPKCPQEIGSRITVVWLSGGFACHQMQMSGRFYDESWVKCHLGFEGWFSHSKSCKTGKSLWKWRVDLNHAFLLYPCRGLAA